MRISREQMFMDIAEVVAKRSTCLRNNVGAIITSEGNNIISIGYNGVACGCTHCTTETCVGKGCDLSLHAEWNAIMRTILSPQGDYSLYVTVSPCKRCALLISQRNIKRVYYRYQYRDRSGIDLLLNKGIKVYRVLPSGEIIEEELEWQGK